MNLYQPHAYKMALGPHHLADKPYLALKNEVYLKKKLTLLLARIGICENESQNK